MIDGWMIHDTLSKPHFYCVDNCYPTLPLSLPSPSTLCLVGLPFSSLSDAVRLFPSEKSLVDYVKSVDYDKQDTDGKTETSTTAQTNWVEKDARFQSGTEGNDGSEASRVTRGPEAIDGKVGMAVIFNKAPQAGGTTSWDYTLRLNYTYGVSQLEEQVRLAVWFVQRLACLWLRGYGVL